MERITLEFAARAVGGRVEGGGEGLSFDAVSTDTRAIAPGCLFLALRGETFNGSDFLEQAFEMGAAACIAERPSDKGPVLLVPDGRAALLALAGAYRNLFSLPVVGVTGSVGKTSTKEMICRVLSTRLKTHRNQGNRNNEIGMPLTVLGLEHSHEAAVFEMGMSGFGEISRMSQIARPDIGVITNIGISHIEKLGSRENIRKAKLEILDGMKPGGRLILNGDDPLLRDVRAPGMQIVTYGLENPDCDVTAGSIEADDTGTRFMIRAGGRSVPAYVPVCGRHNAANALAAFACGMALGLSDEEMARGMASYEPTGLRQKIERFEGLTLIKDCYNASPDSMSSAFDVLKTVGRGGRRVAVLADMLELGETAPQAHFDVGGAAFRSGADALYAFGENAVRYCEGYVSAGGEKTRCRHFDSKAELAQTLALQLRRGDAVLFKGSRGMKLEEAIDMTCERWKKS